MEMVSLDKVVFKGHAISAARINGEIYVDPIDICVTFGLSWKKQTKKFFRGSYRQWATLNKFKVANKYYIGKKYTPRERWLITIDTLAAWLPLLTNRVSINSDILGEFQRSLVKSLRAYFAERENLALMVCHETMEKQAEALNMTVSVLNKFVDAAKVNNSAIPMHTNCVLERIPDIDVPFHNLRSAFMSVIYALGNRMMKTGKYTKDEAARITTGRVYDWYMKETGYNVRTNTEAFYDLLEKEFPTISMNKDKRPKTAAMQFLGRLRPMYEYIHNLYTSGGQLEDIPQKDREQYDKNIIDLTPIGERKGMSIWDGFFDSEGISLQGSELNRNVGNRENNKKVLAEMEVDNTAIFDDAIHEFIQAKTSKSKFTV